MAAALGTEGRSARLQAWQRIPRGGRQVRVEELVEVRALIQRARHGVRSGIGLKREGRRRDEKGRDMEERRGFLVCIKQAK